MIYGASNNLGNNRWESYIILLFCARKILYVCLGRTNKGIYSKEALSLQNWLIVKNMSHRENCCYNLGTPYQQFKANSALNSYPHLVRSVWIDIMISSTKKAFYGVYRGKECTFEIQTLNKIQGVLTFLTQAFVNLHLLSLLVSL